MDVVERRGERSTAVPRWRPDPVTALRFAWMPFRSPSPSTPRTHRPVSGSDRNTRARCPCRHDGRVVGLGNNLGVVVLAHACSPEHPP